MSEHRFASLCAATVLILGLFGPAAAQTSGSAEEAKALVAKAIALFKEQGTKAFEAMNRPDGGFVDRDLYIFVIGPDKKVVAHATDPSQLGADLMTLTDADGKPFGREMIETATEAGSWVDYKWRNYQTGQDEPKSSWVVKAEGYIFGSGVYKR
jgi:cytochrome c